MIFLRRPAQARPAVARRGAVLVEFIACIPLLALVVAATYFFGWTMRNQQRVVTASRYDAWRGHHGRHDFRLEPISRQYGVGTWEDFLDTVFCDGRTSSLTVTNSGMPLNTPRRWEAYAQSFSGDAGFLATELAASRSDVEAGGELAADFQASYRLWETLGPGEIRAEHTREAGPWRRGDLSPIRVMQDGYLSGLDDAISTLYLYGNIQFLYREGW